MNISHSDACQILLAIRKGEFRPTAVYEVPEGEWIYSPTLSLTSPLDGVCGQSHPSPPPAALPLGQRQGTHCIGRVCGSHERSAIPRPSSV